MFEDNASLLVMPLPCDAAVGVACDASLAFDASACDAVVFVVRDETFIEILNAY